MSKYNVTLVFEDGRSERILADENDTIYMACLRNKIRILTDCLEGACATCKGVCVEGEYNLDDVSEEALSLITRYASGSLRDAENLLEQAIVSFQTDLKEDQIRTLLNLDSDEIAIQIVEYIIDLDTRNTVLTLNESLENGSNPNQLQRSLLEISRAILLIKSENIDQLSFSENIKKHLAAISEKITLEKIVKIIRVLAEYKTDNKIPANLGLELVCVEAIIAVEHNDTNHIVKPNDEKDEIRPNIKASITHKESKSPPQVKINEDISTELQNNSENPIKGDEKNIPASDKAVSNSGKWDELIKRLSKIKGKRFNIGALLRDCKKHEIIDGKAILEFTHKANMERVESEIEDVTVKKLLSQDINEIFEGEYEIVIKLLDASSQSESNKVAVTSHLVRSAQAIGALILEEKENTNDESENDETSPGISKKHDENSTRN